jgi:predicted Fe-Mo cluster-binding NifX family protein
MKICLAVYKHRLASLFDTAAGLKLFESGERDEVRPAGEIPLTGTHQDRVAPVLAQRPDLLICGAMSGCTRRLLSDSGITVHAWIRGDVEDVLQAWSCGELDSLCMPGCGGKGRARCSRPRGSGDCVLQLRPGIRIEQRHKEDPIMKIAVSTAGTTLSDALDPRFGRASGFIVYDLESGAYEHLSNRQNLQAPQGAGIQTAQNVASAGAQAVITGHVGPKAYSALQAGGIGVYLSRAGTVEEAVQAFREGRLAPAQGADKPGHW